MTMSQAIFQAIRDGDASQVATLVEMDASLIHATDDEHNRPLHYAAARGHLDIARKLLDAGADVDGENEPWEWRPIVHASWCNQIEMVKLLIERGADARAGDFSGRTPMTTAVSNCAEALELLRNDTPPPSNPPLHKFHRARERQ